MGLSPRWSPGSAQDANQPLLNVCISFGILETFFIIAFMSSWYLIRNQNNTKGVFVLVLLGYIFCFGGVILGILKITIGGAGYHAKSLKPETIRTMLKLIKAHEIVYIMSILFPKLAILRLYHRLFNSRMSHIIIYLVGFLVIATCTFGFISAFANCRPFSSFWSTDIDGHCTMNVMAAFRFYSIPNIASDAILLLIPLPALGRLNVGILTKLGVYLTFLTMTIGIITASLRFVSFLDVNAFNDITYLCITTTSWTIIEPGVYLIAATMPTLRPLIRRIFSEVNKSIPVTRSVSSCIRYTKQYYQSTETITEPRPVVLKKSSKSLQREFFETIGGRPSRKIELDSYHAMQDVGVKTLASADEESLVCADARTQERFAREGRNPDGTLRTWSLQPVRMSPLRTSFLLADKEPRAASYQF